LAGVLSFALLDVRFGRVRAAPLLIVGLANLLKVMPVVSGGGLSLKVVDPSAACQEKMVPPAANGGATMTITKRTRLRLQDR
jgi:hypothetical protein